MACGAKLRGNATETEETRSHDDHMDGGPTASSDKAMDGLDSRFNAQYPPREMLEGCGKWEISN